MDDEAPAPDISAVQFDEQNCAICLEQVSDRCVLPRCFHSCFCFHCIVEWIDTQLTKKTCPLCVTPLGPYILHNLDPTVHKFALHYVTDKPPPQPDAEPDEEEEEDEAPGRAAVPCTDPRTNLENLRRREEQRHRRKMNQALEKRRRIYRHQSYAKHVASNRYTKYRPYPGPAGFRANPTYARLLSVFLQRELQVWPHLDIPFLSFYIPALLSHVDVRSDAVKERLTEWIGNADDAQHLVHEIEMFVRSGRGGLGLDQYDSSPWVQYDEPSVTRAM